MRTVGKFGPIVEVRSGHGTQDQPIFTRIIDKDSVWTWNNGLPTLITTLLQANMVGYGFTLPDMIGGNGYEGAPDKELFIRWLQANVFMPSLQFSYTPMDYDNETIVISHKFTKLHDQYTDVILQRFRLLADIGEPVNPPLWWIDPEDRVAQQCNDREYLVARSRKCEEDSNIQFTMIDDDGISVVWHLVNRSSTVAFLLTIYFCCFCIEFLLGDDIIAAPVIEKGAVKRHVYLPRGHWIDGNTNGTHIGPKWLMDYPAPLDTLPYFVRRK